MDFNLNEMTKDDLPKVEAALTAYDNLNEAYKNLKRADVLKSLPIKVVDKNGNIFARKFKLQIYNPDGQSESWNDYATPEQALTDAKAAIEEAEALTPPSTLKDLSMRQ